MSLNIVDTKNAHLWKREASEHYVEPEWCSRRLFEVERFVGTIHEPCCGFGRIVTEAHRAGLSAFGTDIVDRGFSHLVGEADFMMQKTRVSNIVCNPPFNIFPEFATRALELATDKVAMIWLVPRLNAARWLKTTPLARIWLLTPRPSMPPGHVITAGEKPGGGTQDFCWLVWDKVHQGPPTLNWLHRDGDAA